MADSLDYQPGDGEVILLRKILARLSGPLKSLDAKPGDSKADLLRKILGRLKEAAP